MNAREFIVLADQLAAFNAIMKGDLAKETAAAKDALAALDIANDIVAREVTLAEREVTQKADFESLQLELTAREAGLKARAVVLKDRETKVAEDSAALVVSLAELAQKESNANDRVAEAAKFVEKTQKDVGELCAKAAAAKVEVAIAQQALAVREDALAAKLAAVANITS